LSPSTSGSTLIYLDNAATTPVRREVLEAMWPYLTGDFGNPSSHHAVGERAAAALADARAAAASALSARPSEIVFTSGGSEADNLAIKGIALGNPRGRHIVTTAIEHEAILESVDYLRRLHGFEVTFVALDADGIVTDAALASVLRPDTTLVSIHHANNEIGTVQDVAALAAVAHDIGAPFHTDAVQSAGWLDVGLGTLGVDALTVAGHKLGAPKGTGILAVRGNIPLEPLIHGGGQERGRRSGTENVAGAVGMAAALGMRHGVTVRDALIDGVLAAVPSSFVTGSRTSRLSNHASFCFPGTSGEAVLLELERHGIVCSSGSACAAGSDEPSHVLVALGIAPDVAQTAVRFTLDESVTLEDVASVVQRTAEAVRTLAALG
jgi:cysteine desulfurase